jgi:spermidine synthase
MRREIYRHNGRFHRLTVTEDDGLRVLRFERNPQSSMFIDDPYETDIEYVGYFHTALAIKPDAERTLAIGLGGGSVVKRMWRDYPDMRIDAVELDPAVVAIAREYFALPDDPRIRITIGDGRRFLEHAEGITWDLILVDAFDDFEIPARLVTEEFIRTGRSHLTDDGVMAYNVIGRVSGDKSRYFRSLYRTAHNVFANVWVFVVTPNTRLVLTEDRNIVMLCSDAALTAEELVARIRDRLGGLVTVPEFETYADDLYLEPIRSGDVPSLLDPPRRHGRHRKRR